jgi:hypothetical protein
MLQNIKEMHGEYRYMCSNIHLSLDGLQRWQEFRA